MDSCRSIIAKVSHGEETGEVLCRDNTPMKLLAMAMSMGFHWKREIPVACCAKDLWRGLLGHLRR